MTQTTVKNGDRAAYRCPQRNSWLDGRIGTVSAIEGDFCSFTTAENTMPYRVLVSSLEPVRA